MRRRAAKKDKNHNPISQAMRDVGYLTHDTSAMGDGFGDEVWAGIDRQTGQRRLWLIEYKTKDGKLTKDEQEFHEKWAGFIHVVRTVDDGYRLVGILPHQDASNA